MDRNTCNGCVTERCYGCERVIAMDTAFCNSVTAKTGITPIYRYIKSVKTRDYMFSPRHVYIY